MFFYDAPMQLLHALSVALIPSLPLVAGCAARRLAPAAAGRLATHAAAGSLVLAAGAAVVLAAGGAGTLRLAGVEGTPPALTLKSDAVAVVMALLVSFLGWVVIRFSRHYLAGDPGQARFFSWLSLTLGSVLVLVLAGDLLLLAAAWVSTSLFLHRLLLHHRGRPGAVFAARKKFVVSRLGDLCMVLALWWILRHFGTWDLDRLFAAAAAGNAAGLHGACALLAACAALKSAQFPFHSWLPDTMETPTPVSAFMHAGIINAGGFLVVRLSPLFVHAPAAMQGLALLGTVTAAFGAVVMLVQPSVKRSLAYSTIAQMGFMLLQCGLGAFALALIHIMAHSLYKAHAFLHAGSTIGAVPRAAVPLTARSLVLGVMAAVVLVAAGVLAQSAAHPGTHHPGVLAVVLALALAYGLARSWSALHGGLAALGALGAGAAVVLAAVTLHAGATALGAGMPAVPPAGWLTWVCGAVFALLFAFQVVIWRAGRHPLGRRLYVHALNGFYIGTWANRLLARLWPRQSQF
jgi:NAD(P)H-quinone oxidoreductase subunit 5